MKEKDFLEYEDLWRSNGSWDAMKFLQ